MDKNTTGPKIKMEEVSMITESQVMTELGEAHASSTSRKSSPKKARKVIGRAAMRDKKNAKKKRVEKAVEEAFTIESLPAEVRKPAQEGLTRIQEIHKATVKGTLDTGKELVFLKRLLGHSYWLPFVRTQLPYSERKVRQLMDVHESFKTANFADLEKFDVSALYVLAGDKRKKARNKALKMVTDGRFITYTVALSLLPQKPKSSFQRPDHKTCKVSTEIFVTTDGRIILKPWSGEETQTVFGTAEEFAVWLKKVSGK